MGGAVYIIFNMKVNQIDESLLEKDNSGIFAPEGQIYFSDELGDCLGKIETITKSLKIASMNEFVPSAYRNDIEGYAGKPIEEIDNVEEIVLEMSKDTWFAPEACLESLEIVLVTMTPVLLGEFKEKYQLRYEIDKDNVDYIKTNITSVKSHLLSLKNALLKAKEQGALFRFFYWD